ncbi:MAG: hypothetical protein KBA28_11225 [Syntrophaceae bacterium]|jgi:hypothetical protein|nr:hypothetical protein [Syntrophaceae bacterium]
MNADRLKSIRRYGKTARGQRELLKHLSGERLTLKQAVHAHCYECMGFFADGKIDCGMKHCPLHPFMAYNQNREKGTKRTMSNAHMEKMRSARRQESNLII